MNQTRLAGDGNNISERNEREFLVTFLASNAATTLINKIWCIFVIKVKPHAMQACMPLNFITLFSKIEIYSI